MFTPPTPRVVPAARKLDEISYDEMLESSRLLRLESHAVPLGVEFARQIRRCFRGPLCPSTKTQEPS